MGYLRGWHDIAKLVDLVTENSSQVGTFWRLGTIVRKVFGHVPRARTLLN